MIDAVRDRLCPVCDKTTQQQFTPTANGCGWRCEHGHMATSYSKDQMLEHLSNVSKLINYKPPAHVPSCDHIRVYITTAQGEEAELDHQFVKEHCAVTGTLPKEGQPLLRRMPGIPSPFNILSYSKVRRIECP